MILFLGCQMSIPLFYSEMVQTLCRKKGYYYWSFIPWSLYLAQEFLEKEEKSGIADKNTARHLLESSRHALRIGFNVSILIFGLDCFPEFI